MPPIKSRKVLTEKNEVITSLIFSKDSKTQETLESGSKVQMIKSNPFHSSIPRHAGPQDRLKQGNVDSVTKLIDPEAVKRREDNIQRALKMMDVTRDKLDQTNKKLEDANAQMSVLAQTRAKISEDTELLKRKIDDAEVEIVNVESKISQAQRDLDSSKVYEEQRFTLIFKERNSQILKDLEELESEGKRALEKAQRTDNKDLKEEIVALETEVKEKSAERDELNELIDQKLEKRRKQLDLDMEKAIVVEESKNEEFYKDFEIKTDEVNKLNEQEDLLKDSMQKMQGEIDIIDADVEKAKEIESISDSKLEDLLKQLAALEESEFEVDLELQKITEEADQVASIYDSTKVKIEKEKSLRRRIQNSIEDYNGKLRTYVKINNGSDDLKVEYDDKDVELQTVSIDNQQYRFNKIFTKKHEEEIIQEIITFTENALKGISLSLFSINTDSYINNQLIESTLEFWTNRAAAVERYQKWKYTYSFQAFQYDDATEGFIDLQTKLNTDISYEDSRLESNSSVIRDFESLQLLLASSSDKSLPTVINLVMTRSEAGRSIDSSCIFIQIPKSHVDEQFKKMLRNFSKSPIESNKFYELIHSLYINSKSLSLFEVNRDDSDLLKVAKALSTLNSSSSRKSHSRAKSRG
jgi:hypothetical protein